MPIDVGDTAPDFTLPDQNNTPVRLSGFRGRRDVLLVFFPLAYTAVCRGELCQVRDGLGDFVNDRTQLLAVSVDSVPVHQAWAEREGYTFPLLADFWPHGEAARSYGVFDEARGIANRGTFLIDRAGVVRFAEMNGPGTPRDQQSWRDALSRLDAPARPDVLSQPGTPGRLGTRAPV